MDARQTLDAFVRACVLYANRSGHEVSESVALMMQEALRAVPEREVERVEIDRGVVQWAPKEPVGDYEATLGVAKLRVSTTLKSGKPDEGWCWSTYIEIVPPDATISKYEDARAMGKAATRDAAMARAGDVREGPAVRASGRAAVLMGSDLYLSVEVRSKHGTGAFWPVFDGEPCAVARGPIVDAFGDCDPTRRLRKSQATWTVLMPARERTTGVPVAQPGAVPGARNWRRTFWRSCARSAGVPRIDDGDPKTEPDVECSDEPRAYAARSSRSRRTTRGPPCSGLSVDLAARTPPQYLQGCLSPHRPAQEGCRDDGDDRLAQIVCTRRATATNSAVPPAPPRGLSRR